eukprot:Hpha_TRINITY_DN34403_c0_g1::TRINITY_DN34403_c0_g1_i1::g.96223::m.96223/K05989/ramA; alpha-L-rhamnosidase
MLLLLSVISGASALTVSNLRTEYLVNPLGLDTPSPSFSWQLSSTDGEGRGLAQAAYQLRVLDTSTASVLWDSGKVSSKESSNVVYNGTALQPATVYAWMVAVTSTSGATANSPSASFSTGLGRSDWEGNFIGLGSGDGVVAPWFRTTFELPSDALSGASTSALLYVASVGFCQASVNGQPASNAVLAPSISYLPSRVLYKTYNVTGLLAPGANNTIGLWASAGWSKYMSFKFIWPTAPLVMAELRIDGKVVAATDGKHWFARRSTSSRMGGWGQGGFGGEWLDLGMDVAGWDTPTASLDGSWEQATQYTIPSSVALSADVMEPTIKHSAVPAARVDSAGNGKWLVTMSELFTGWFEIDNMVGAPGSNVSFHVSTTSGKADEFNMIDQLTFGKSGKGSFQLRFAYHEIHYITIDGLATAPSASDITGWRLTSDLDRTGHFECSNSLLTKVYETTVNNYIGLTTGGQTVDCPHRERRGYGGDGHTSYQFALANFGVGAYFTKWARDFADVQNPDGDVPHTAPTVSGGGGPAWSGFVVTMPWQVYVNYGDTSLLRSMFPVMERQLAFYAKNTKADGLLHPWDSSMWDFLGDWITPHGSESNVTSPENLLFNNCYLHYITSLTSSISRILGYPDKAATYETDAQKLAAAINTAFYSNSTGAYVDLLQTHLVMPLATGVVPANLQTQTTQRLQSAIDAKGGHLDTGLTANYFMTKLFTDTGRNDLMFTITNQTTFPSYGYFLEQGYTTWPEQWNVDECCSNSVSKMHGCYNAVGLWFVQGIGGITVDASDAEAQLTVRAGVDSGDVRWAKASRAALRGGVVESSWAIQSDGFAHNVTVPGNNAARILVPAATAAAVLEDGKPLPADVKVVGGRTVNSVHYVELQVDAGVYRFTSNWKPADCKSD